MVEAPGDLLRVDRARWRKSPIMMEFPVPETAPYLVTSTRSLFWIHRSHGNKVRAATRDDFDRRADLYMEIVQEVSAKGVQMQWGNVQPMTSEGLGKGVEHLEFYGLGDLVILASTDMDWARLGMKTAPEELLGHKVISTAWLNPDYMAVIPEERDYLGFVMEMEDGLILSVVHNASRAMAVLHDRD